MTRNESERLAQKIGETFKKSGASAQVISDLKELRNYFIAIKDPSVTKILRLTYEHLEANQSFDIIPEEFDTEGELSSFEYLMELMTGYDNKYNREELQEYKQKMLELVN
jgi:hypothetical protein